jgi:16S rRNA pseudouridine516 synthase
MRRDAGRLCKERDESGLSRVTLSGEPSRALRASDKVDPSALRVDGEALPHVSAQLHILLNKPAGYVCTHAEDDGETIYSLFPSEFMLRNPPLQAVGRLDKMATGLMLLTQDGTLNDQLCNPRRACPKTYMVALAKPLRGTERAAFAAGRMQLVDGSVCAPAELIPHAEVNHVCTVILREGRHHQLRRMFAEVGHSVTAIHRTGFGGLSLDKLNLAQGDWRFMTEEELVTALLSVV